MSKIGQDVKICTEDITNVAMFLERDTPAGLLVGSLSVVAGLTAGGKMVFVKVRETYDLHTVQHKMTVIGIHTPKPDIIKANFPGLLMQCKAYRPVSADVKIACASVLPLDPQGVGLAEGDVAPEDVFNPILYKACSNLGMSQIEARINAMVDSAGTASGASDVDGQGATVDVDTLTQDADEFPIYYGFLSNAHGWKHANPQSGLAMKGLRPLVYEVLANVGDQVSASKTPQAQYAGIAPNGTKDEVVPMFIRGNAKPIPFINCTSYSGTSSASRPGFIVGSALSTTPLNAEQDVPWINCVVGAIIIPPSRLHELFYRMVVEWTIEFSQIRPLSEITDWTGLGRMADITHYQNYSYEATKQVVTGDKETILESDACMVSANVEVQKVM